MLDRILRFEGLDIVPIIPINISFDFRPELSHTAQRSIIRIQQDVGVHSHQNLVSLPHFAPLFREVQVDIQYAPILLVQFIGLCQQFLQLVALVSHMIHQF